MSKILITGAASGLGLAMATALSHNSTHSTIYAVDRQPVPHALQENAKIRYRQLDLASETEIRRFADVMDSHGVALDMVIHSAGVRGLVASVPVAHSDDVARAETWDVMDASTMSRAFQVNALGFFLLMQALMPSLQRAVAAGEAQTANGMADREGGKRELVKVVVLGSRMGSIGHNAAAGKGYAYRASKAALDAIVKSFAVDVADIVWTIVHPGRVETGLVAVKEDGAITVEDAVADLLPLVEGLGLGDSGRFIDRFGVDIPW